MATTIVQKLFTWQFIARRMVYKGVSSNTILVSDGLALTIAGSNIREARAQFFTAENPFKTNDNMMIYITKKTYNTYPSIQEMIMREEPTITSSNGIVFTSTSNKPFNLISQ
jgi:hypothetical protein